MSFFLSPNDGMQGGKVVHDPLVLDYVVQWRVSRVVHGLDVSTGLDEQPRGSRAGKPDDVGRVESVHVGRGIDAEVEESAAVAIARIHPNNLIDGFHGLEPLVTGAALSDLGEDDEQVDECVHVLLEIGLQQEDVIFD